MKRSVRTRPTDRIVITMRDSSGALIRMHGTTRERKELVIERFRRDHNGNLRGYTIQTTEAL
jgi:hypothetical protein